MYPGHVCIPDTYVSRTRMYPGHVCIPDTYVSRTRMYPGHVCIPDTYVSRTRMYPGHVCIPDTYVSRTRMYPGHVCIPDTYVSRTRMYPGHVCIPDKTVQSLDARSAAIYPCRPCFECKRERALGLKRIWKQLAGPATSLWHHQLLQSVLALLRMLLNTAQILPAFPPPPCLYFAWSHGCFRGKMHKWFSSLN
jgi:hypothetical protein